MTNYAIINPQNIVTAVTRPAFLSLHFSQERHDRIVELWQKTKYPVKVGDKLEVCRAPKSSVYVDRKRCWCCSHFYAPYHNLDQWCIVCEDKDYEARVDAAEYERYGE